MSKKKDSKEKKCRCKHKDENKHSNEKIDPFCELGPLTPIQRREKAFKIRKDAAKFQENLPLPNHPCNGDEALYSKKFANFSKTLPHNKLGEVDLNAYQTFIQALSTGNPAMFEEIPLGDEGEVKLANPQASYAYDLMGPDSHHLTMPPAPNFDSPLLASEMAEDYWSALTRDIPFDEYETHPLTIEAANDLSKFSDFTGPKVDGKVTPHTLFRGNTPGDLIGPYISQFLYKDIPFGDTTIEQRYDNPIPHHDFMTHYKEWLNIQDGRAPKRSLKFEKEKHYIRNGRDLGQWVHIDFSYQSVLTAALILIGLGNEALAPNNPYLHSKTQYGFVTFGKVQFLDFVGKAVRVALEAAWFQKFLVHRMLRPEAFGGCVHNDLTGASHYPINPELLHSKALEKTFDEFGTYLLPMAYPEGSPSHPSYPAGHACGVGAGVTMLKAFFDESYLLPNTVIPSKDGLSLVPYLCKNLTIGGELNKLASNICIGRDLAGVHYRSDGTEGLEIGEQVAIQILQDYKNTYNEKFNGFRLTKFDGTTILI